MNQNNVAVPGMSTGTWCMFSQRQADALTEYLAFQNWLQSPTFPLKGKSNETVR